MRRSLALLSAIVTCAAALGAQKPSAYSYDFRTSGDHSDGMRGTVRVSGGRARVDMDDRDDRSDREYLLVSGDGDVVTVVKPRDRTYTVFAADSFAHIASLGMRAAEQFVTMKLRDATIESAQLGAGEVIAGHQTQHVRLTEEWTMDVGAMGFTAPVRAHVEMDYYFDPSLRLVRNPLMEIVESSMTLMPGTDAEFAAREDSVRRSILHVVPLRTVITEHEERGHTSRMVFEVTRIGADRVAEAELKVPPGYTRQEGDLGRFRVKL